MNGECHLWVHVCQYTIIYTRVKLDANVNLNFAWNVSHSNKNHWHAVKTSQIIFIRNKKQEPLKCSQTNSKLLKCRLFQGAYTEQIKHQHVGQKWKLDSQLAFALEWRVVLYSADSVHWGMYIRRKILIQNHINHFIVPFEYSRYGLRGRELINNVGKVMVQGGGTFGTFMAIGTGIRC